MNITTNWIKTGKVHDFVFIGKDVIATASGNYVIFFNLVTKEEKIEYFNCETRGEGASCLAGHSMVLVFSTAERCLCPKIFIHTYPEIKKVAECKLNKGPNSYLSCCFAGTEYLLSLTSFPNFKLIVWLWRTGVKLASVDSNLIDENQIIETSLNSPHFLYQFSSTLGKLLTYEICSYSKKVTIIKNYIKSIENKIAFVSWTNSNNLLICDILRNVYVISTDGKKTQLILHGDPKDTEGNQVLLHPFNNGFLIVNTHSLMTCYRKTNFDTGSSERRKIAWRIQCTSHPLKISLARHKEAIFICCKNGKVFQIIMQDNKPIMEEMFVDHQKFKYICSLKSLESYCVLVDITNSLLLLNVNNGKIITNFHARPEDEVLSVDANPSVPLLGISTLSGKCIFLNVSTDNFRVIKTIYLQRQPIDKIKFSKNGTVLGASSLKSNYIFLIDISFDGEIKVGFHKQYKELIIDFLIFEDEGILQMLTLVKTSSSALVGNIIHVFCRKKLDKSLHKNYTILMSTYYHKLEYGSSENFDFIGFPYLSKQLHFFKIENNNEVLLNNIISSGHKLRKFDVSNFQNYIISSGFDGYIILRTYSDLSNYKSIFMVHHYTEKGTKSSIFSVCEKVIVSLGANGSLVGLSVSQKEKENKDFNLKNIASINKVPWVYEDNNIPPVNIQTWLEEEIQRNIDKETTATLPLKTMIDQELKELRIKLKTLLDLNENKNLESRLPISEFDLDLKGRENKINEALNKQEDEKILLQAQINQTENLIEYLMENYWNVQEEHDCTLVSFSSKICVNNYSLQRLEKLRTSDDYDIELFNTPLSIEDLKLNTSICKLREELPSNANTYFNTDCSTDIIFSGSTSFKWIKDDIPPNQLSTMIFDDVDFDLINSRENKLKILFNKKFDEMKCLKGIVIKKTEEQLKRLNKCKSELESMFGIVSEEQNFSNIKWQFVEISENVILEEEFNISLSNENEEQLKCNEAQNVQLKHASILLEPDDKFREEKLNEMMDGLLEIRWEDEIKKDVPKPACLMNKPRSKYDKNDIEAAKIYKMKVKKLEEDRQKYKAQLESEISEIKDKITTDMEDFDRKMERFSLEKIKVQSAILQEFLLRITKRKRKIVKDCSDKKIFFLLNNDLALLENENEILINELSRIEPMVAELKTKYESLNKRDKVLEGKFRGEFGELKQPIVEHLLRQYKRRPRIGQITCTSSTCLAEMNKCIMVGKKSTILPREYLDFLRGMDALDVMPSSLPPQIDALHWQSLCKLRRNKVEIEIKIKIAALELAEAEQTYFYLQKLSSTLQSKIYFLKNNVEAEKLKQSTFLQNPGIQLVLKSAQIEITISGHWSDFDNATVVIMQQLIEVNNEILREADKKIAAMRSHMNLRKSILYRSWKYQCMLKKLKHLKEHLAVLQNTKIGKEMQNYLVERNERKFRFKNAVSWDKILKSVDKKFKRVLKEEKTGLLRVNAEIKYWHKKNAELINMIEQLSLKKQERCSSLEENDLQKRNKIFRQNQLHFIMERTNLVEKIKESHNELLNLQTQLELLKLKTYPTLRFKDAYYRTAYLKKIS